MSGLLYYIKGAIVKPKDEELKACGLGGQVVAGFCQTEIFLDGSKGVIFTLKGKFEGDVRIGFYNEEQHWVEIPGSNLYIGFDLKNKPKPKDFLKKDFISGHNVMLGDDQEWVIPLARKFHEGCVLPKTMLQLREEDEPTAVVVSKFLSLQVIANKLATYLGLDDEKEIDQDLFASDKKFFNLCVKILNYNYNLDFREVSVLTLFNTDNTIRIIEAVVDVPYIMKALEERKKTELEKKK